MGYDFASPCNDIDLQISISRFQFKELIYRLKEQNNTNIDPIMTGVSIIFLNIIQLRTDYSTCWKAGR